MQKNFRKVACRFNDEAMEFSHDKNRLVSALQDLEEPAQKMLDEINSGCHGFASFKSSIRVRRYIELSFYVLFTVVFILSIAGFESGFEVFGLAWFFLGFFIIYFMLVALIIYYISSKLTESFNDYILITQEIISKYNRTTFIKNNVFVSFKLQVCDAAGRPIKNASSNQPPVKSKSSGSMANSKYREDLKNKNSITFIIKSRFRSTLMKLLKVRFWIEFLISDGGKGERNVNKQMEIPHFQQNFGGKRDSDYEEKMVLKHSHHEESEEHYEVHENEVHIEMPKRKGPNDDYRIHQRGSEEKANEEDDEENIPHNFDVENNQKKYSQEEIE